MKAVYIPFYRQRTLPNINEEWSVQGQISQIIPAVNRLWAITSSFRTNFPMRLLPLISTKRDVTALRSLPFAYTVPCTYGISVCQRMIIRSHTQIYVMNTLGISRVRSSYADIRRCTLFYAEAKLFFWSC